MPTSWTTDNPDTRVSWATENPDTSVVWHGDDIFPYSFGDVDEVGYFAVPYSGGQRDGYNHFRKTVSGWSIDSSDAVRCSMTLTQEDLGEALPTTAGYIDQPFGKILITNTGGGALPSIDFTIHSAKYQVFDIDVGKPHYFHTAIGKNSGTSVTITSSCEYFGGDDVFGDVSVMDSNLVFRSMTTTFKPTRAGVLKWKMRFQHDGSPGVLWTTKRISLYRAIFGRSENIGNAVTWTDD